MNINDYLLAQQGSNWGRLLRDWMPPLPSAFTLWLVNRFGHVFAVADDNSVIRLDAGTATCERVASSREHFAQLLDSGDHAENWLMLSLTDACRRAGLNLRAGQCYGFKIPPVMGGDYEITNIVPTELSVHYSYLSYIHKQTDVYWMPDPS